MKTPHRLRSDMIDPLGTASGNLYQVEYVVKRCAYRCFTSVHPSHSKQVPGLSQRPIMHCSFSIHVVGTHHRGHGPLSDPTC